MFFMSFPLLARAHMKNLINSLELQSEIEDLEKLGLTREDIEGYLYFFLENWMDINDSCHGN